MQFGVTDKTGRVVLLLEAADRTDAELYAHRHVAGFDGRVIDEAGVRAAEAAYLEKLAESFRGMGYTAEAAAAMAEGRGVARPDVVRVSRQEAEILKPQERHKEAEAREAGVIELREFGAICTPEPTGKRRA